MNHTQQLRSLLVSSGLNVDKFKKSLLTEADINLMDLEDAVAPALKAEARSNVFNLDLKAELQGKTTGVRINSVTSIDGLKDIDALCQGTFCPDIIVLPKVEAAWMVSLVDSWLTEKNLPCHLWAIIETPVGVANALEIALSSDRLSALSFGAADYSMELNISLDWDALLSVRSLIVMAGHAAGLDILDSPTFNLEDHSVTQREATLANNMGFTGKICIHPDQLHIINKTFSAEDESVIWAKKVQQAVKDKEGNIKVIDGQMIGPPFVKKSEKILAKVL